jgi:glycosyltransferase involved in cell wall biosynthesis
MEMGTPPSGLSILSFPANIRAAHEIASGLIMKISIVIPVFNEQAVIESNLLEIESCMVAYVGSEGWEVIAVNDGSEDGTVGILYSLAHQKTWLKVLDLPHYGRGRALRRGIDEASGEMIVTLDADLSYAPFHIEKLCSKLALENVDIVVASAYGTGGTVLNVPWKRLWISKLGNKILSYMFSGSLTVLTCVVRAYKREFIQNLDLHSNDKEIHLEILAKAKVLGAKMVEVPATLDWRTTKREKKAGRDSLPRRTTLNIRKTSYAHIYFALLSKPGLIFWVPGFTLFVLSFFILLLIARAVALDPAVGPSLFHALRNSMLNAPISWFAMVFSFLLGVQFFTLGFITNQNKSNQEETYRTLNAIYRELKKK